jgi:hypothetical protein
MDEGVVAPKVNVTEELFYRAFPRLELQGALADFCGRASGQMPANVIFHGWVVVLADYIVA